MLQLIQALYSPNPPETITAIQEVLQRLQKSDQGWQLAKSLIENREDNIKFFAALTLIVKLNRERCVAYSFHPRKPQAQRPTNILPKAQISLRMPQKSSFKTLSSGCWIL